MSKQTEPIKLYSHSAAMAEQPAPAEGTLTELLNNPEVHYPGNFDTPQRAVALLTGLCQDAAIEIERLNKAVADERERLYGKDIDTLLFEEHRLAFEKGRRSEREACAKLCEELAETEWADNERCAAAIRARGNT